MSIHKEHRKRVKQRFLGEGLDHFDEIHALELLLFYAIPRIDVNPLAHRLLHAFGSLHDVLSAPIPALCEIEGMNRNTAAYLHLIASVYAAAPAKTYRQLPMNSPSALCAYFQQLYAYESREVLRMVCLDEQYFLRSSHVLAEGSVNHVTVSLRKIIEHAILDHCAIIVLAHNHPKARASVSRDDLISTRQVSEYLKTLSISLYDHIIVGEDNVISMRDSACMPD
mgnify:CR=1 FL=1